MQTQLFLDSHDIRHFTQFFTYDFEELRTTTTYNFEELLLTNAKNFAIIRTKQKDFNTLCT